VLEVLMPGKMKERIKPLVVCIDLEAAIQGPLSRQQGQLHPKPWTMTMMTMMTMKQAEQEFSGSPMCGTW